MSLKILQRFLFFRVWKKRA